MPQTLLAILGIVLLGTTTMSIHAGRVHLQSRAIAREMEEMGTSLGLEVMEVIRSRAFDQAVINKTTTGAATDLNLFSYNGAQNHFTTGNGCSVFGAGATDCNDIDDFHKMQTATLPFVLGSDSVYFDVDVEVEYVDDSMARYNGRTFNKQVTVYVQDAWPGSSRDPYLTQPIEIARVFSYTF
ncbi:MAG TPA: hypothetical protein VF190_02165 [Rhodothermales bacterium]